MVTQVGVSKVAVATKELNDAVDSVPVEVVVSTTTLLREVSEHRQSAQFVSRLLVVIGEVVEVIGDNERQRSEATQSPYKALLDFLALPTVLGELRKDDPLAAARIRGLAAQHRLISAEGEPLTAAQVGFILGITRQAVDKRRNAGTLIGVTLGKRGYRYPSWQLGLNGLETVLHELKGYSAWAKLAFMLTPNNWLDGETPLAVLKQGKTALVLHAAKMYGEHVGA